VLKELCLKSSISWNYLSPHHLLEQYLKVLFIPGTTPQNPHLLLYLLLLISSHITQTTLLHLSMTMPSEEVSQSSTPPEKISQSSMPSEKVSPQSFNNAVDPESQSHVVNPADTSARKIHGFQVSTPLSTSPPDRL
jgi:hypothetical protein